jgi:hypothetical protein
LEGQPYWYSFLAERDWAGAGLNGFHVVVILVVIVIISRVMVVMVATVPILTVALVSIENILLNL